jgi:hypothetical protein
MGWNKVRFDLRGPVRLDDAVTGWTCASKMLNETARTHGSSVDNTSACDWLHGVTTPLQRDCALSRPRIAAAV